jgi:hypothetical protein
MQFVGHKQALVGQQNGVKRRDAFTGTTIPPQQSRNISQVQQLKSFGNARD